MGLFTADMIEQDSDEAGIHDHRITDAVLTWVGMNDRRCTLAEAMMVFNTTAEVLRSVLADHPWCSIVGDPGHEFFELDGE